MNILDLARQAGTTFSRFTERWVPDSWVICMILTTIALILAVLGAGAGLEESVLAWGEGVWDLLSLAMQFSIAMVAASACVSSKPVYKFLDRLAGLPDPEKPHQAILVAALFSFVTGYLNWALCLVSCAFFVPFLCNRNPRADIRILVAACYLGVGTVWHGGLSGSAPLILATPGNPLLDPESGPAIVDRLYPVTETLFHLFNLIYLPLVAMVSLGVALVLHPKENVMTLGSEQLRQILPKFSEEEDDGSPRFKIENFRGWIWLAVILFAYPLGHSFVNEGFGTSWTINAYNTVFLVTAMLLHGRPLSFLRACRAGVDSAWGIIVQFPFYAGIFGLMIHTDLGSWIGDLFSSVSSTETYPFVVYIYSGFMNLFVPSAGSKWLIEAPFLIPAAKALDVSVVTTMIAYSCGDSTTNLVQPFFAIPILAVTRLRFGEVVGYMLLIALACALVSSIAMFLIPSQL